MGVLATSLVLLAAAICAVQQAELIVGLPSPIGDPDDLCKDCSRRSVSRDQECRLEITTDYQPCFCDIYCVTYGDCCPSTHYTCVENNDDIGKETQSETFLCQQVSLGRMNESSIPPYGYHYWMVTLCNRKWLKTMVNSRDMQEIQRNCTDHLDSIRNPPVTNLDSGLVYRNEYCACCNNVSGTGMIPWDYGFHCDNELSGLLNNSNYILTESDFNKFCTIDAFIQPSSLPPSLPPARHCYPQIDSCMELNELNEIMLTPWNSSYYQSVVDLCREGHFQNHVVLFGALNLSPYRNKYCALCNGIDVTDIECFTGPPSNRNGVGIGPAMTVAPLNIILDIFGNGRIATKSFMTTGFIEVSCPAATEVYDPVIAHCRPIVNTNDYGVDTNGNGSSGNCSSEKLIALMDPSVFEFVSTDILIYNDDYYMVEFNTSNGTPVICVNFSSNSTSTINFYAITYSAEYLILTYIGCPLSVMGCIFILITYSVFKELRTLPSQILMQLAVAILFGNVLILVSGSVGETLQRTKAMCTLVAILTHYAFLSQFLWMSLISTEITRNFYQAYKMRARESKAYKIKLLVMYTLLGWGTPLLIVVLTVIVNFTNTNLVLYAELEDGSPGYCWINHIFSLLVAFVIPLAISLIYNTVVFLIATIYLCVSSLSHSRLNSSTKLPFLRLNAAIFSVSGITWIFGFIALLPNFEWAWIPYTILNSSQGFIIFVAFLCTKKVALLYRDLFIRHWHKGLTESSSTKETLSSSKVCK